MVFETLATIVATRFVDRLGDRAAEKAVNGATWLFASQESGVNPLPTVAMVQDALAHHLAEADHWASRLQIEGMSRPRSIASETLPLQLSDLPRRFRPETTDDRWITGPFRHDRLADHTFDEDELLSREDDVVLLGAPGAGKTTTIRRLVQRLLTEVPEGDADPWAAPLVVVLREQASPTSAPEIILRHLRLHAQIRRLIDPPDTYYERRRQARAQGRNVDEENDARERDITAEVLDACGLIVFFDGLDEVSPEHRQSLETSINLLARRCREAKIVVSCRSGDYNRNFEGFTTLEICDLSADQVQHIARLWLGDDEARGFLESIDFEQAAPARANVKPSTTALDLANRPLFLGQMLTVYDNLGTIPTQPSSLCRQVVRLVIQDWDRQNKAKRRSRYANFEADGKLEFLSHFAFVVSFDIRRARFGHMDLTHAYRQICDRFDLPANQAHEVAREIETHTGLVAQVGYESFEFSHLSLQEYLAGEYLARLQRDFDKYLVIGPAVVAVAVALSADPGVTLASLMATVNMRQSAFESFVARLQDEKPRYQRTQTLGSALFCSAMSRILDDPAPGNLTKDSTTPRAVVALLDDPMAASAFVDYALAEYDLRVVDRRHLYGDKKARRPVNAQAGLPRSVALFDVVTPGVERELVRRGVHIARLRYTSSDA